MNFFEKHDNIMHIKYVSCHKNVDCMSKKIICILLFLICHVIKSESVIIESNTATDHTITVFVHGTSIARRMMNISPLRPHVYCPQGLTLAKELPKNYRYYGIAKGCAELNNKLYSLDNFYIFGWRSESFNHRVRMKGAANLMQSLQKVVSEYYEKHKVSPYVRIIGFSHGGNVVLNSANFPPLQVADKPVDVEAWLIATPVQQINHDCVNHPHFKKVYSVYSKKDWLQRIDPQGIFNKKVRRSHFWSDRTFRQDAKCIQVKFTVNSKSISHTSYRPLFKHFPSIQNLIEQAAQGLDAGMIEVDFQI
jgi:hypothetical protein